MKLGLFLLVCLSMFSACEPIRVEPVVADNPLLTVGSFDVGLLAVNGTITVQHGLRARPVLLVLWTSFVAARADLAPPMRFSFGASDGTRARAVGMTSAHGGVGHARRSLSESVLVLPALKDQPAISAQVLSLRPNAFTIAFNRSPLTPFAVHYLLVGGGGSKARVVDWRAPAQPEVVVAGSGFDPSLVWHVHAGAGLLRQAEASHASMGMGFADKAGAQFSNTWVALDTGGNSEAEQDQTTSASLLLFEQVDHPHVRRSATTTLSSDGFSLQFSAAGDPFDAFSIVLGGVGAQVGAFTKPTSAPEGAFNLKSASAPVGLLLSSVMNVTRDETSSTTEARWGFGAAAAARGSGEVQQAFAGIVNVDSLAVANTSSASSRDHVLLHLNHYADTTRIDGRARLLGANANAATLHFSENSGQPTQMGFVLIGPVPPANR